MKKICAMLTILLSINAFAYSYVCSVGDGAKPTSEFKGTMASNSKALVATVNDSGVYLSNKDGRFLLGLVTSGMQDMAATISDNVAAPLTLVYIHGDSQLIMACAISADPAP